MKAILTRLLSTQLSGARFDAVMLFFRVAIGTAMFFIHGWKKITDFAGTAAHIPDPFGMGGEASAVVAVLANVVCTGLIIIGLFTRPAAAFILGVTLVGLIIVHAPDPWAVKDVPLMYSLAFGLVLVLGPGRYSVDYQLFNKK
ncbi:MAG: DoxX family protein [Bacteroidota bacterium]